MNETDEYILNQIKILVWGGFESISDIQDRVSEMAEDEGSENEALLLEAIKDEIDKKEEASTSWPNVTDVDKLNRVFSSLKSKGILCLHNAGYTMSDGHYDAREAINNFPKGEFYGYCFYHGQDLERAVNGDGLYLAYDHINGDIPEKLDVAAAIKAELEVSGFQVNWDGTTNQRIEITNIKWQNRGL